MKKQKQNNQGQKKLFLMGAILFVLGVVGIFFWAQARLGGKLDHFFSSEAALMMEVSLTGDTTSNLAHVFPEADFESLFDGMVSNYFAIDLEEDVTPWIGRKAGIAMFDKGDFVMAAKYRSRSKVEKFLNKFKLPTEAFEKRSIKGGEIWTPAFSSNVAVGFYKGFVLFSTSVERLEQNFLASEKMADLANYKRVQSDLPRSSFFSIYADTEQVVNLLAESGKISAQKPLLQSVAQSLPAIGLRAKMKEREVMVYSKILSHEGVFAEQSIPKKNNQMMPELAQFVSQDTLFFMNGSDIYDKYRHTKQFLAQFHPQFSVIFDGVLRAKSREVFGEKFDFEKDFLSHMHGQYAVVFDFENALQPFVNFTLITGFGSADTEQNMAQLQDVIHFAQGQFSTQVEEVQLPDGSVREELTAIDQKEIPIKKIEEAGQFYFTAQDPSDSNKKFSYGFLDGYFVFSTHETGVKSVFSSHANSDSSLTNNADFRESILFRYSPSGSYGFFNVSKFISAVALVSETEKEWRSVMTQFLSSNVRNITFAKKVFPEEIFWTATLFSR
jgi:hypothetical protein